MTLQFEPLRKLKNFKEDYLMEQRIASTGGADVPICAENMKKITKELNAEGFELTFIAIQSKDNNPATFTDAILVFTKK